MKPKVIVFTTAYHPFIGGAEIAIQEIAGRLKDRFDFYIITSRFRRDLPKKEVRPEGVVIRFGFGTSFDKWLLPFWAICHYRGFASIVLGVDISQGALAAAFYKFLHPALLFIFNIQYGHGEERLRGGRLGAIGSAFRFILRRADYVTAISTHLFDLARRYGYKGPAEVVPNGVDLEKFKQFKRLNITGKRRIIITTSRLVPKNGVDILIKAMAEAKKKMPDIRCWILGDGPESGGLKLRVESLKLNEVVKFLGAVPYEKIPEYLHQADLFVRPSRSEGMGNSFVEALAAGLPIIGTKVGGITDIIEDGKTGLFARVDDSDDLAGKIIRLLADRNLAESIVREGRKMVEEMFSWDKIAGSYAKIFDYYRGETSIVGAIEVSPLRILIATPLFPPQIGGPAIYAKNLGEEFEKFGCDVRVVSFTCFLRYPSGIRHLFYFLSLLCRGWKSDIIFALDYTSVGFPSALASRFLRKPLMIRVEGDFLWESFVQRTRKNVTLPQFYQTPRPLTQKERLVRKISGWVMRRATRLVFSSEWRRSMVLEAYGIAKEKTEIIHNTWPRAVTLYPKPYTLNPHIILWAGRMLYLKNLHCLIRAFSRVNDSFWQLHLVGDGPEQKNLEDFVEKEKIRDVLFFPPLGREKLLEKMKEAAFLVLPSFSEVGPNIVAEGLSVKTPFIMTQESGYREYVSGLGLLVEPFSERDLESKMKILMDDDTRRIYREKLEQAALNRNWTEAAQEWIQLFQSSFFARTR